jgi:hypothetical protein
MSIDLEQRIRERAYDIWERDGRADGRAEEHWHAAKLELTGTRQSASSEEAIAVPAKPKGRRKAPAPVEAAKGATQAAPRRRRSTANTLPN